MKTKITIYSKDYCPYCVRAKDFFKSRGHAFDEIDVTRNPETLENLIKQTGHLTVPQIFIDDKFIGGYTDLIAKFQRKEVIL